MKSVKVRFLEQCILPLSSRFFNRGDVVELEEGFAKKLEGRKIVVILKEEKTTKKPEKETKKATKTAKKPKKETKKPEKEVEKSKKETKKPEKEVEKSKKEEEKK